MSDHKKVSEVSEEQKFFILEEKELKPNFFGLWHRHQVSMGQVWMLYQDGNYHKILQPGPHLWFSGIHTWRIQIINQNIELIRIEVSGRVRGPSLNKEIRRSGDEDLGEEIELAGMGEFACDVTASLGLSCGITRFETFLRYRDPLSVFLASVSNMVHEIIGQLPYDSYGGWAQLLRKEIRQRLQVTDSAEKLVGMTIEDVYVTSIIPNSRHDRNMLEMYQNVERARRELIEAKENKKRDRVVAESFAEQGDILNIAPALLKLQDSPIGKALIENDTDLKKLMVAAGLNPGVNVQAIPDVPGQLAGGQAIGYLQSGRRPEQQFPPDRQAGPSNIPLSDNVSGTLFSMPNRDNTRPYAPTQAFSPHALPPTESIDEPIDSTRMEQELLELTNAGFMCAGRGQFTPTFDENGQPIPGSKTWILEVFSTRANGYLTMVFHCPTGYPRKSPRVQMRPPAGGGLQWIEPNSTRSWHPGNMLVTIAKEISDIVQD